MIDGLIVKEETDLPVVLNHFLSPNNKTAYNCGTLDGYLILHPYLQPNGELPVAPSAIAPEGVAFTHEGYGRLFISNPDLPKRFRLNVPLND